MLENYANRMQTMCSHKYIFFQFTIEFIPYRKKYLHDVYDLETSLF